MIAQTFDNPALEREWPVTPALTGPWMDISSVVMPRVALDAPLASATRATIQRIMWERVSLRRDAEGLTSALAELRALAAGGPYDPETANMLLVAQGVTLAALSRDESRGGHYRMDFPERDTSRDGRHSMLWPALPSPGGRPSREVAHA